MIACECQLQDEARQVRPKHSCDLESRFAGNRAQGVKPPSA